MNVVQTDLAGVLLLEPKVFADDRGFFLETYHATKYAAAGITGTFVQDNHSRSLGGNIVRGLHAQRKRPQGKLVRCVEGAIFDVAVDIRIGSPTFGKWVGFELSETNFHQLWIPPDFAHGFCVLRSPAQVEYKCTDFYDPTDEIGVIWNDPTVGVPWPVRDPLLSPKDKALPRLQDCLATLPPWRG